uniref:Target of rapamycin complex subunit lst8 n=1 Tax=Strigamia maritima TaxID=126957 RepID=T1JEE6_STRMM
MGIDNREQVILATGGYDHTIRFWQAHSGICHRTQVNALEITPDRQLIAATGYQNIRVYDLNSINPNPVIKYEGLSKNVTSLQFHEDGKWMITGGEDSIARIWDLRSRSQKCQRLFQVSAPVNCIRLHPNQGELVVGDQNGTIHIWDLNTDNAEQITPDIDTSIQSVDVDPERNYLAAVNSKGTCYVWGLKGGVGKESTQVNSPRNFQAHKRYALKCKFSPDSTLLVTTSADQTAKIWKTVDFSLVTELKAPNQRWVWDVAFSADSQYAVTASSDNFARLWSVETGEVKREYSGHQKALTCLAFHDSLI